jgi:hypothetical protein
MKLVVSFHPSTECVSVDPLGDLAIVERVRISEQWFRWLKAGRGYQKDEQTVAKSLRRRHPATHFRWMF